jgi:hypothetical protein
VPKGGCFRQVCSPLCPLFAKFRRPLASVDYLWQCILAHKIDAIIAQGGWSHKPGPSFDKARLAGSPYIQGKRALIKITEIRVIDIPAKIRKLWRNALLGSRCRSFFAEKPCGEVVTHFFYSIQDCIAAPCNRILRFEIPSRNTKSEY